MRLNELWLRDARVCQLCLEDVVWAEASRDHKVPKSHKGANSSKNLQLAHRVCNVYRDVRSLDSISIEEYRANRQKWLAKGPVMYEREAPYQSPPPPRVWRCSACGGNNRSRMLKPPVGQPYRECQFCYYRRYAELPGDPIG